MIKNNKKILLVYDVSYPFVEGGGQRRLFEVAHRMCQSGYVIDWVCFKTWPGDSCINAINESGIKYIGLPGYNGLYRKDGSRRRLEPLEFLWALWRSKVDFSTYDIIWTGQWPLLHLAWLSFFPKKLGLAKLAVDWWEIWGETWLNYSKVFGPVGYLLEKLLIARVSQLGSVVLISEIAYKKAKLMVPDGNFIIIHNGIEYDLINKLKQPERKNDIVYLGRLKDHKRVDILLSAIHLLKINYGIIASAIVIGDGPEMFKLKKMTNELMLGQQIVFLGGLKSNIEAYRVLKGSKIFVNPSIKEGGGSITLFEAFAAGLPVVAFNCKDGIDPELVGDGIRGKLVPNVSPEALASCLHELLTDNNKLINLQCAASSSATSYDWDIISKNYIAHFEQQ